MFSAMIRGSTVGVSGRVWMGRLPVLGSAAAPCSSRPLIPARHLHPPRHQTLLHQTIQVNTTIVIVLLIHLLVIVLITTSQRHDDQALIFYFFSACQKVYNLQFWNNFFFISIFLKIAKTIKIFSIHIFKLFNLFHFLSPVAVAHILVEYPPTAQRLLRRMSGAHWMLALQVSRNEWKSKWISILKFRFRPDQE